MSTYIQHPCQSYPLTSWPSSQQHWHQQQPGSCSAQPCHGAWPSMQSPAGGPLPTLLPEALRRDNGWRGCDPRASHQQRPRPRVQHPRQSTINMPPAAAQCARCSYCNLPRQQIPDAINTINSLYAMQSPRACSCNVSSSYMPGACASAQRVDGVILPAQLPSLSGLQNSVEYLHWRLQYSLEALQALSCLSSLSNLAHLGRQQPCSGHSGHGSPEPFTSSQQPQAAAPVMTMHPHRFKQVPQGRNCSSPEVCTAVTVRDSEHTSRQQPDCEFTAPASEGAQHTQHTQLPPWWRASQPPAMSAQNDEESSTSSNESSSSSSSNDVAERVPGLARSTQHQMHPAELTLKHHAARGRGSEVGPDALHPSAASASAIQGTMSHVTLSSASSPGPVSPAVPAGFTTSASPHLPAAVYPRVPYEQSSSTFQQVLDQSQAVQAEQAVQAVRSPVLPYPPIPLHAGIAPPAMQAMGTTDSYIQQSMADISMHVSSVQISGGSSTASMPLPSCVRQTTVPEPGSPPQQSQQRTPTAAAAALTSGNTPPLPPADLMAASTSQLTNGLHPPQQTEQLPVGHARTIPASSVLYNALDGLDDSLADSRGSTNSTDSGGTSAVPCYLGDSLDRDSQLALGTTPDQPVGVTNSGRGQQAVADVPTVTLLPAALQVGRQRQRSRFGEDTAVNDRYARRTPPQLLNMDDSARRMQEIDAAAAAASHASDMAGSVLDAAHEEISNGLQQVVSSPELNINLMALPQSQDATVSLTAPECGQASTSPSTSSAAVLHRPAGTGRVGVNSGALPAGSTLALADAASLPHPSLITSAGLPHRDNVSSVRAMQATDVGCASSQGMGSHVDGDVLLGTMDPATASSFPCADPTLLSLPADQNKPSTALAGSVAGSSPVSSSSVAPRPNSVDQHQYLCRAFGLTSYDR